MAEAQSSDEHANEPATPPVDRGPRESPKWGAPSEGEAARRRPGETGGDENLESIAPLYPPLTGGDENPLKPALDGGLGLIPPKFS